MQIYLPEHESTSGPHFVVYLDRRQMRTLAWRWGRIAALALFSFCIALPTALFQLHHSILPPPILIFDAGSPLFALLTMSWRTWQCFQLSSKEEPVLIINHEGILLWRVPGRRRIAIPWSEIETISAHTRLGNKMLSIRLKKLQTSSGQPFQRRKKRYSIFQIFLEKPIPEILYVLQQTYARELSYHNVWLQP